MLWAVTELGLKKEEAERKAPDPSSPQRCSDEVRVRSRVDFLSQISEGGGIPNTWTPVTHSPQRAVENHCTHSVQAAIWAKTPRAP